MKLTPEQIRQVVAELEAWGTLVEQAGNGFVHLVVKLDVKERRVIGIRGGAEAAQARKVS